MAPRRLLPALAALAVTLTAPPAAAAAPATVTLVVDRDRAQCGSADFTSIQAAVDAAPAGAVVRVCPDIYPESVRVDKPLTLWGQPDSAEAVDCFATTATAADDLDPTQQVIIDPPGDGFTVAVDMSAPDVTLAGFVVQGASVGVDLGDHFAGNRMHHNLIRLNTLFGIDFGASGGIESRVDHNCLRDNRWGLVSELDDDTLWALPVIGDERGAWNARDLITARIDHNRTFRNLVGIDVAGPGWRIDVAIDHNASREESSGIVMQHATNSAVIANEVSGASGATAALGFGGGNTNLTVADNVLTDGRIGIAFLPNNFIDKFPEPSRRVTLTGNTARGMVFSGINAGPGLPAGTGSLRDSVIAGNVSSGNGNDGIILPPGNTGLQVRDNLTDGNRRYGIYSAAAAAANTFTGNVMTGNLVLDARDDNRAANVWMGNQCTTDSPAGTICGVL
ncbi:NosD domain-containing protein [Micromonospora sp. MS34]|uniref:NosD domain-containing protein n=1 Tax=Micromonospora sp. MS34 TaxID=3385971 RepID=UPI0039A387F7